MVVEKPVFLCYIHNDTPKYYVRSRMIYGIHTLSTGCPNKHGNSVTKSISSFQIILWFSIVIPTEKAIICKSFVCYMFTFCLFMFWLHTVVLSKTRKLQYTNRVNLSDILRRHYRHIFTHLLPFSKNKL